MSRVIKNYLGQNNLEIASEWHPIKNGDKLPHDFTSKSDQKVWWQCSINPNHEWEVRIVGRANGTGCRFCAAQRRRKNSVAGNVVGKDKKYF